MDTDKWKAKIETFSSSESVLCPEKSPQLELKPLLDSLKYVVHGPSETLPVIIASDLDKEQEIKLSNVLKKHKEAIGQKTTNIKGKVQSQRSKP
ncbi:hypothetical protein L2V44_14140, partial [Staphylococcus aureus]|nr:hypothetical protein [Staphylococcus aureus]